MDRALVVGLGNPGRKYAGNRHNVGFQCVERLASAHGLLFDKAHRRAKAALGAICEQPVVLVRPQTYMNESGQAVAPLVRFYQVPLDRLLVVVDDLDLPLGVLRMRPEGGTGGHKGMASLIQSLGGQQGFARLRVGIGRPPGSMDPAAFVLQDFSSDERLVMDEALERAVEAIERWLTQGIDAAMNCCNVRAE